MVKGEQRSRVLTSSRSTHAFVVVVVLFSCMSHEIQTLLRKPRDYDTFSFELACGSELGTKIEYVLISELLTWPPSCFFGARYPFD